MAAIVVDVEPATSKGVIVPPAPRMLGPNRSDDGTRVVYTRNRREDDGSADCALQSRLVSMRSGLSGKAEIVAVLVRIGSRDGAFVVDGAHLYANGLVDIEGRESSVGGAEEAVTGLIAV